MKQRSEQIQFESEHDTNVMKDDIEDKIFPFTGFYVDFNLGVFSRV